MGKLWNNRRGLGTREKAPFHFSFSVLASPTSYYFSACYAGWTFPMLDEFNLVPRAFSLRSPGNDVGINFNCYTALAWEVSHFRTQLAKCLPKSPESNNSVNNSVLLKNKLKKHQSECATQSHLYRNHFTISTFIFSKKLSIYYFLWYKQGDVFV